jgi:hypothetical protein
MGEFVLNNDESNQEVMISTFECKICKAIVTELQLCGDDYDDDICRACRDHLLNAKKMIHS